MAAKAASAMIAPPQLCVAAGEAGVASRITLPSGLKKLTKQSSSANGMLLL
eukprot:CAMPEP_0206487668 /NCGR_PEP_ID=MMETSP0324_2-20121206/41807_1 /ASSEMBLY_ACC=CAM_ASM_000836 /TAXON_ID=2866 /ORGANISM="Crypthecodinium cohnii, Strain Seligo" /LENGTH=50 /DNA_ID=CAMNT_0053966251 /DNA_START=126 /DNA_END=274 /DNA_ORIENTATION=+